MKSHSPSSRWKHPSGKRKRAENRKSSSRPPRWKWSGRSIDREGLQPVPRQFIKNNGPVEKLLRSEITADICLPAPFAGQFRGEDEYPPVISRLLEKERSKDGGNHFQKFSFPFFEFIENSFVSRERRRERIIVVVVGFNPSFVEISSSYLLNFAQHVFKIRTFLSAWDKKKYSIYMHFLTHL